MFGAIKTIFFILFIIALIIIYKIIRAIKRAIKSALGYAKDSIVDGLGLNKSRAEKREERRQATPCYFEDGITEEEFNSIVKKSGKYIKRLTKLSTWGTKVKGTVRSQSGISEWEFEIDFNDYGHVTGNYWILWRENWDSNIPDHLAKSIAKAIKEKRHTYF